MSNQSLDVSVLRAIHESQALGGVVASADDVIVCAKPLPKEAEDGCVKSPVGMDWRFAKYLTDAERARFVSEPRDKPSVREFLVLAPAQDAHAKTLEANGVRPTLPSALNYLGYVFSLLRASFVVTSGDDAPASHAFWEALAAGAIPIAQFSATAESAAAGLPVLWTKSSPPYADISVRRLVDFAAETESRRAAGAFSRLETCMRPSAYPTVECALIEKRSRYWVKAEHEALTRSGVDPLAVIRPPTLVRTVPLVDKPTEHPDAFLRMAWDKIEESPNNFDIDVVTCVLARARKANRALLPEELALLLVVKLHRISNSDPRKIKFLEELRIAERLNASGSWSGGLASRVFSRVIGTAVCSRALEKRFAEDDAKSVWNARYPQVGRIVTDQHAMLGRPLRIVEVGAARGGLGAYLMAAFDASKIAQMVSLDPFTVEHSRSANYSALYASQGVMDRLCRWACERTKLHSQRWKILRLTSEDAAWSLRGDKFDIVYVDGGATAEDVEADIRVWSERVAPGGALVFAEYGQEHVKTAVDALAARLGAPPPSETWNLNTTGFHGVVRIPPLPERSLAAPRTGDSS